MARRALLSIGLAGMVASALRAVGFDSTAERETGGWRDLTSEELLSPRLLPEAAPVDLTEFSAETV